MSYTVEQLLERFEDAVAALEDIASCVEDGTFRMRDVDRAKVYGEHLGERLRDTSDGGGL